MRAFADAPSHDLARHLCRLVGVLARETEVGKLEDSVGRDEQVVGFHVLRREEGRSARQSRGRRTCKGAHAMEDPVLVAKVEALDGHEHPRLDVCALEQEGLVADDGLEVRVEELEDEVEVGLDGEDVEELGARVRSGSVSTRAT